MPESKSEEERRREAPPSGGANGGDKRDKRRKDDGGSRRGGPPGRHGRWGPVEKPEDARQTLKRLMAYVWDQRAALVWVILLVALSSALGVLGPYMMGLAIDEYIVEADLPGLARLLIVMLVVYLFASGAEWLQRYIMAEASQTSVLNLRNDLFAKLQTLSLRFFDQYTHGELMSRLTNDVDNVSQVLGDTVINLISSFLSVVGVTVMMFIINWRLALVTLTVIPLMGVMTRFISKRTRAGFRERQEHLGDLNGIIEETVTGHKVVKAYVREEAVIEEFEVSNRDLQKASVKAQTFAGFVGPLMNFVNNTGYAAVAAAGGWLVLRGLATVGSIASFVNYARQFARPLNQIAQLYNQIQSALAGAERVFAILDEVPDVQDKPDALPLTDVEGDVVFEHVSFYYDEDVPVLKDISFHAEPGQTIALVGPTGAGKTTIVNLLTRFYDIQAGTIKVDGHDIRDVKLHDLRRQLGIVLQDTFLFGATVMENIRYGRLDASDEEVIAAAKLANAHSFIHRLPGGYQSVLTENGSNLSQGQRQLLAIARAILADPGILVLDEATSSVDTRTERQIQQAMLRLMEGRTSFVIAHRLSTIRRADQILVINEGELVERGTHEALLKKQGFYHHLYVSQFKGREVPELVEAAGS
ncbi:MAG: ABC transporter ATP-binding protein [Anaerolineae bacterium]